MNSNLSVDRLSSLPKNVIENILMRMPIWDAVRTSTLARGWRYEWSTLPKVVIDMKSFLITRRTSQMQLDRKIVIAVDHILLLHRGPIHTFTLSVDLGSCNDVDRWILFLSRNGVEEFILETWEGLIYKLPSCFFSCADITYLGLNGCAFIPSTAFKGFSKLRAMTLLLVSITDDVLATLLSLCPLLSGLILRHITGCTRLKISAQKLVKIVIDGAFDDIHFESTPLLAFATINLLEVSRGSSVESDCRIVKVHGKTPKIYELKLLGPTLQNLFVGDVPLRLPAICPVKDLLVDINFEDTQEMRAAFCIFRSSITMQKLCVTASSAKNSAGISSNGFWVAHESFNCTFSSLRVVEMTNVIGITSELKFIEFVLANAPVLEKLHIKFREDVAGLLKILGELMRYPRISPKAKVFAPV